MAISYCTGCSSSPSASPSEVYTSWSASAAAGSRHELIAVQRVPPLPSGRETMTAQAPHSPSAQPSLTLVRPLLRRKFSAVVWAPASLTSSSVPLTLIAAWVCEIAESVMASSNAHRFLALLWAVAWLRTSEAGCHAQVIHAEQNVADEIDITS